MRLRVITVILVFLGFALSAQAEDKTDAFPCKLDSYLRYTPSRAVDVQSGKVELIKSELECSYELQAFGKLPVRFAVTTEYLAIENTTLVKLPAHLTGAGFDVETTLPFFNVKDTYFRFGLTPSFFGDDFNFRSSAFRIPMRYFVIRQPNEKLTLIAGVAVYPDFEKKVWPILGFIYKANDRLTFDITPKRPNITYVLNKKIDLFVEGGLSLGEFEVSKDNLKNVVLAYSETHLGTGIKYKINKFIQSSVSMGGAFNREFKYRDSLGKINIKDGLYTELRIEAAF